MSIIVHLTSRLLAVITISTLQNPGLRCHHMSPYHALAHAPCHKARVANCTHTRMKFQDARSAKCSAKNKAPDCSDVVKNPGWSIK